MCKISNSNSKRLLRKQRETSGTTLFCCTLYSDWNVDLFSGEEVSMSESDLTDFCLCVDNDSELSLSSCSLTPSDWLEVWSDWAQCNRFWMQRHRWEAAELRTALSCPWLLVPAELCRFLLDCRVHAFCLSVLSLLFDCCGGSLPVSGESIRVSVGWDDLTSIPPFSSAT